MTVHEFAHGGGRACCCFVSPERKSHFCRKENSSVISPLGKAPLDGRECGGPNSALRQPKKGESCEQRAGSAWSRMQLNEIARVRAEHGDVQAFRMTLPTHGLVLRVTRIQRNFG